jgi:hypothetical protein
MILLLGPSQEHKLGYNVATTHICTVLGFIIVIGFTVRQAFNSPHLVSRRIFKQVNVFPIKQSQATVKWPTALARHFCFCSWKYAASQAEM